MIESSLGGKSANWGEASTGRSIGGGKLNWTCQRCYYQEHVIGDTLTGLRTARWGRESRAGQPPEFARPELQDALSNGQFGA